MASAPWFINDDFYIGNTERFVGSPGTSQNTAPTTPLAPLENTNATNFTYFIGTSKPVEKKKLSEIVPLGYGNRKQRRKRLAELKKKRGTNV